MPGGDIFISFSRLKTSTSQGISIYPSKESWEICPVLVLAVSFITATISSKFVFNHLKLEKLQPEVDAMFGAISQLEGQVHGGIDESSVSCIDASVKVESRKRPSAAQFTNKRLQMLEKEFLSQTQTHLSIGENTLTSNLQSHSLRRGAAQHVNSSPKISISWLCTRGNWAMDSLSKAFAYIGTTLEDDQKVAKRLSMWEPDEAVVSPHLSVLFHTLHTEESKTLQKVQHKLFENCRNYAPDSGYNITDGLYHACFASVLIHVQILIENRKSVIAQKIFQACSFAGCSYSLLQKASNMLRTEASFPVVDPTARENAKCNIETRLARLEEGQKHLCKRLDFYGKMVCHLLELVRKSDLVSESSEQSQVSVDSEDTAIIIDPAELPIRHDISIAAFFYSWYLNEPWKTPRGGKKVGSFWSECCATLSILKIVYSKEFTIPSKPDPYDYEAFGQWKREIRDLAEDMETTFNARMHQFDKKKATAKASGVRNRYGRCSKISVEFEKMMRNSAQLKVEDKFVDHVTPLSEQKEGERLEKFFSRQTMIEQETEY